MSALCNTFSKRSFNKIIISPQTSHSFWYFKNSDLSRLDLGLLLFFCLFVLFFSAPSVAAVDLSVWSSVYRTSPLFLSTVGLLLVSHSFFVLCHSHSCCLAFTGFLWFILLCCLSHFSHWACSPSALRHRSIWWSIDSSPGQVSGTDGESAGEEGRLCLQTPLRGVPAEVICHR